MYGASSDARRARNAPGLRGGSARGLQPMGDDHLSTILSINWFWSILSLHGTPRPLSAIILFTRAMCRPPPNRVGKPVPCHLAELPRAVHRAAQGEHVGAIVLAAVDHRAKVVTERRPYPPDLVRRHADPMPAPSRGCRARSRRSRPCGIQRPLCQDSPLSPGAQPTSTTR